MSQNKRKSDFRKDFTPMSSAKCRIGKRRIPAVPQNDNALNVVMDFWIKFQKNNYH